MEQPQGDDPVLFPTLGPTELAELAEFGEERRFEPGEVLYAAGAEAYDFFVILEGEVQIVRIDGDGEDLVTTHTGGGRFVGELNLLTGQRAFLTARASAASRLLAISPDEFRRVMSSKPDLSNVIFGALMGRRELLQGDDAPKSVEIIGSRFSPGFMKLRSFALRSRLAHSWTDLEDEDDPDVLLASRGLRVSDTPAVLTPNGTLRNTTPGEFAEHLGLTYHPVPGHVFDLVVVGTGPGGLAASVYGASEGLDTVSLDAVGAGGQAGASSRIENYMGFPNGVSGGDLTANAAIQAQRLGARLASPCEAIGLRVEPGFHVVQLTDDSEIPCRAVIIATGAQYRRLAVDDLERFEGAGVYYAATDLEVKVCATKPVIVVGGGNSAGQAAIYLSQQGCRVSIALRRRDLAATMSRYLIDRIEADPHITVMTCTEVRGLSGDDHLAEVTLEHTAAGETEVVPCAGLFCFIGAIPATEWLGDTVQLDGAGFILTDRSLPLYLRDDPAFGGREPLPFETSVPGVFAVGDVRNGSMKRVAAAVGEGSSAVRAVHAHLATAT